MKLPVENAKLIFNLNSPQLFAVLPSTVPSSPLYTNVIKSSIRCLRDGFWGGIVVAVSTPVLALDAMFATLVKNECPDDYANELVTWPQQRVISDLFRNVFLVDPVSSMPWLCDTVLLMSSSLQVINTLGVRRKRRGGGKKTPKTRQTKKRKQHWNTHKITKKNWKKTLKRT